MPGTSIVDTRFLHLIGTDPALLGEVFRQIANRLLGAEPGHLDDVCAIRFEAGADGAAGDDAGGYPSLKQCAGRQGRRRPGQLSAVRSRGEFEQLASVGSVINSHSRLYLGSAGTEADKQSPQRIALIDGKKLPVDGQFVVRRRRSAGGPYGGETEPAQPTQQ